MFNLIFKGQPGAVLPNDWQDRTTPVGKATQTYLRALAANGITDLEVKGEHAGKTITIPVTEYVHN